MTPATLPAGTADKVRKLLEVARERQAELGAVLNEIEILMGGGAGIGELLKRAERLFEESWRTRYPGSYVWQYGKDRVHMKRLIQALGVEELQARFNRFIRNDDPFFSKARHSFGAFVSSVNQHAAAGEAPAAGEDLELASLDSDAAATQRRLRAVRGQS